MKALNKKISVVALTGLLLTGSFLSQGSIAHADCTDWLLDHHLLKNPDNMDIGDIFSYISVQKYQSKCNYNAVYLGNEKDFKPFIEKITRNNVYSYLIPKRGESRHPFIDPATYKYFFIEFDNELVFEEKIEQELNKYRYGRQNNIIIKVGDAYFKIYFCLTHHERNVIPLKVLANEYDFTIGYADSNDWYGKIVIESNLDNRDDLKNEQQLKNILKEEPLENGRNLFRNAEEFADALKSGAAKLQKKFSRFRIGDYDFIIKSNK